MFNAIISRKGLKLKILRCHLNLRTVDAHVCETSRNVCHGQELLEDDIL